MRSSAEILLGAALFAVGFAHACVPPFTCETDEQCDAQPGGRCDDDNHCVYDDASTGPGTTAASIDPTTAGPGPGPDATTDSPATTDTPATDSPATTQPAETDSNTTTAPDPTTGIPDTDTDETTTVDPTDPPDPPPCDPLDELYPFSGKPTGLAVAPDGTIYLAGVSSSGALLLSVRQIHPDGTPGWVNDDNETAGGSSDHDTDIWLRAFLDGDELVVVYSERTLADNNQDGPYVATFAAANGDIVGTSTLAASLDRSLRGASMVDAGTMLVAGENDENLWYQRLDRAGTDWDPAWLSDPDGFTPTDFYRPAIAQGIAVVPGGGRVFVGGTWDDDTEEGLYRAWLRGLSLATGATDACECERFDAGVLALAVGAGGELYLGGFQGFGTSGTWFGRFDAAACPTNCELDWDGGVTGSVANTEFYRAEFVQDAIYSVVAVPGGAVFAGALDKQPFAARYDADGSGPTWDLSNPAAVGNATVLAMSVSPDGSCLTLAGSADYSNYADRTWWVHREQLP
jgi:hypothetical protein